MNKRIQTEIIINAPKEKVWEVLTNFKAFPEWNPFIVSIEGRLEKGSRLTNTMINEGRRFVFRPKVLEVKPNVYFDWLGSLFVKGLFDGHHYFRIEELEPGQVKLTHGEHFTGILASFILRKIGDATRNNFVQMNNAIRQRAESFVTSKATLPL